MTTDKDLKRLVRARMKKTGEAYTTARAQVTSKPKLKKSERSLVTSAKEYASLAGMSDAVIMEKTGCNWERWVKSLDYHGAAAMSHGEIADLVRTRYKVADWWTQAVTVGYERIKGLRARGQRRDGTFESSKSRTFDVPVRKLFDAWNDAATRRKWLDEPEMKVRTATSPKSMRIGRSDGTIISLYFTSKGARKSSVAVQHTKLPDKETAEALKSYWSGKLDTLATLLAK